MQYDIDWKVAEEKEGAHISKFTYNIPLTNPQCYFSVNKIGESCDGTTILCSVPGTNCDTGICTCYGGTVPTHENTWCIVGTKAARGDPCSESKSCFLSLQCKDDVCVCKDDYRALNAGDKLAHPDIQFECILESYSIGKLHLSPLE